MTSLNIFIGLLLLQQFYMAPLQVIYSGALPAQPRSINVVLKPYDNWVSFSFSLINGAELLTE